MEDRIKLVTSEQVFNGEAQLELIGAKAYGISFLRDYPTWVPKFIILPTTYIDSIREGFDGNKDYLNQKISSFIPDITHLLTENEISSSKVIIRSSAVEESLLDRGAFDSTVCVNNDESILSTLTELIFDWFTIYDEEKHLALIIQNNIHVKAKGHLSNERRVSQFVRDWLIDYEGDENLDNHTFKIFKHRYKNLSSLTLPKLLLTDQFSSVASLLHHPAELVTLFNDKERIHFEWVWDGSKIWIVQADKDVKVSGCNPNDFAKRNKSSIKCSYHFNELIGIEKFNSDSFKKTRDQSIFREVGMETTPLFIVKNKGVFESILKGVESSVFDVDILELLKAGDIVIRSDINEQKYPLEKRQNLPRSSCLSSLIRIKSFIKECLENFCLDEIELDDVCFIIHNFIPSISSAFAYATPNNPKVRVDSIWGLPDGLQYYSHDSFEINTKNNNIYQKTRFKSSMLGVSKNGPWEPTEVGEGFDWKPSIGNQDITHISTQTIKLAKRLNKPVYVMWFVNCIGDNKMPRNIPWYFEENTIEGIGLEHGASIYSRNLFTIKIESDIKIAEEKFINDHSNNGIILYPSDDLIRNNVFLEEVASLTIRHNKKIIFMGSTLQHAFYQLKSYGANVSSFQPFSPSVETIPYNKLVRDNIADILTNDGEIPETRFAKDDDLLTLLQDKLAEESEEVANAVGQQKVEELADLIEVIETICVIEDITLKDILRAKNEKKIKKGGFKTGLFLVRSETKPTIEAEIALKKEKTKRSSLKVLVSKDKFVIDTSQVGSANLKVAMTSQIELTLSDGELIIKNLKERLSRSKVPEKGGEVLQLALDFDGS